MYSRYHLLLAAATMALWMAAVSGPASAHDIAKHIVEAEQKRLIIRAFDRSDHLRGQAIRVSVHEGLVTLGGKVGKGISRQLATQLALGVEGVRVVDNRLRVEPGYRAAHTAARRNYAEMAAQQPLGGTLLATGGHGEKSRSGLADAWLTIRVKATFFWIDNISSRGISVSTRDGVVFLSGSVADGAEHALAIAQAGNVPGVKGVVATEYVFLDSLDELEQAGQVAR